ncbi:hypothetical protein EJB05_31847 [Eragrostis curvula]|uniref:Uncharacterized protein n=1 Tax=Eragrostis curvula TaxID=38414 RepID=A0A5J9UEK7_9POAL|nr:hypothetical protein EJB05_31847 [Eragrostis curvula]
MGPPEMLIDHFANEHSQDCSIVALRYGQELKLTLTAVLRWHALVGLDRSLFLVSRRESGTDTAVSVCCVRANDAGDAASQYKCRLAVGFFTHVSSDNGEVVIMESKVLSSRWPGVWPTPAFMGLVEQLDDTVTLSIRIDQLQPAGVTSDDTTPDMDRPLRMERGLHRDGKKGKVGASATTCPVKQVEMEGDGGAKFYCYCCTNPLRPPIYQLSKGLF